MCRETQDRRNPRSAAASLASAGSVTGPRTMNDRGTKSKSRADRRPIRIGTYNIRNGRAGNLESALRAMEKMNMDVVLLTETKLTGGRHTKGGFGYQVVATDAETMHQGGVALIYRESEYWQVESVERFGKNVIRFQLVTGTKRINCVGGYIPPTDVSTLEYIREAFDGLPNGPSIVLGDLNVDFNNPRNDRATQVVTTMVDLGLDDSYGQFCHRRKHREGFTWQMRRNNELVKARCDYILGTDRGIFGNVQIREPRHYSSDHFMVVGTVYSETKQCNARYLRSRKKFPLCVTRSGPQTEVNSMFQEIKTFVKKVKRPARIWSSWIRETTWEMIDRRASLRQNQDKRCNEVRQLSRQIARAIKADRKARTVDAGTHIERLLEKDDLKGAWRALKAWYNHASERGTKPSIADLTKLEEEYRVLYTRESPPGDPVPVLVAPFDVNDDVPSEAEIAETVQRMKNGKAPGPSGIRAEHLKEWLMLAERERHPQRYKWNKFMRLVQIVFETGELPTELAWSVLVLIPKGSGGFRGIGLLEIVWKVMSAIIDARLKNKIEFHDSLHGFRKKRGTATASLEAKLQMQAACAQRKALYQIFIDLAKAYDTLDRGRTLEVLKGYGTGPRVLRLLKHFWDGQAVVARQGGYHSQAFDADKGVTQGDIPSPTIFNVVVDVIVRAWELEVSGDQEALQDDDFAAAVKAMFYADDGIIASYSQELAQDSLNYLVELFERMGLRTNTSKTKSMTCSLRPEKGPISTTAYKRRLEGDGPTHRERQRRRSECPLCKKGMTAGYLPIHLRQVHGGTVPTVASSDTRTLTGSTASHSVSFPPYAQSVSCPVEGCPGRACTRGHLRRHFMFKHPLDQITIIEEGPLPRCGQCDMFVTQSALVGDHCSTALCRQGAGLKQKRATQLADTEARAVRFTVRDVPIDSERWFLYLGRLLSSTDDDWAAVLRNLAKARQRWGHISGILRREGANPRVSAMFYKAVVQTVLLFGSESWVLTPRMLSKLEGFHTQIARRLTGRNPTYHRRDDRWKYHPLGDAMQEAGMFSIDEYITRRRNKMVDYIASRPIYAICREMEKRGANPGHHYWWNQLDCSAAGS